MQDISGRLDNNTLMSDKKKPIKMSTKDPATKKKRNKKNISSFIKLYTLYKGIIYPKRNYL